MKKTAILLSLVFIFFLYSFSGIYSFGDWRIMSNFKSIYGITSDMNYVYANAGMGIIVYDKFNDKVNTLLSFRNEAFDVPFSNLIADPYNNYNVYFSGRKNVYHYDWFNDTLYVSQIPDYAGKVVTRLGVTDKYLYAEAAGKIFRCMKTSIDSLDWKPTKNSKNVVWSYSNTDFTKVPQTTPTFRVYKNKHYPLTVYMKEDNYIWMGSAGLGMFRLNLNDMKEKHFAYGSGSFDNRAICLDSTGSIWTAGFNLLSISRYFPETDSFEYFDWNDYTAIPDNQITFISASRDFIMFTTDKGQAFFYDIKNDNFMPVENEEGTILFRSCPIDNERFIASNENGLGIIDTRTLKYEQIAINLPSVINVEFFNDTIYAVSENILYKSSVNKIDFKKAEFSFPTFMVYQFFKTDSIEIILDNAYIHIKQNTDTTFNSYAMNMFGEIYDLYADSKYAWICGNEGIGRFDLNAKRWKIYNRRNAPMPKQMIYSLFTYNGYLYAGTSNAFIKFYYTNPLLNE